MKINLLLPEIRERQRTRRRTFLVAGVGVGLLVLLGVFYMLLNVRLSTVREDLEVQQAENATLQVQIDELRQFEQLQQELEASRALLATLLQNEVHWSGVLRDISLVIPGEDWLETMTGQISEAGAEVVDEATGAPAGAGLIGNIQFTGVGFDHRSVALWLSRLEDVRGFVNVWLANSTESIIDRRTVANFTSSVDLSSAAAVKRKAP